MFLGMKVWFPEISFPLRTHLRLSRDELEINEGLRGLLGIFFFFAKFDEN